MRPFSPDVGTVSGVGKLWRLLWVLLATFASPATIEDVDTHLRSSNSEAAEKIDADAAVAGRGGSANCEASKEARADGGSSSSASAGGSLKSADFKTEEAYTDAS